MHMIYDQQLVLILPSDVGNALTAAIWFRLQRRLLTTEICYFELPKGVDSEM